MNSFSIVALLCGLLASLGFGQPVVQRPTESRVLSLDRAVLDKLMHERNGRPLLLNVWATWCAPCVEEFPDLVRLDSLYRSRGLDVVVLSIDDPEDVPTKVVSFLRGLRVTMPAYVNGFAKPEALIDQIDPRWSGAIPMTFLYDRNGTLTKSLMGKQEFASLRTEADRLLRIPRKR